MRITVNLSRRGLILFGLVIGVCILLTAACATYQFVRIHPSVRVSATVTDIQKEMHRAPNEIKLQQTHYVSCTYSVGGTSFSCRFRTLFPFCYREGKTISIFCGAVNPMETADHFLLELAVCATVFLGVILLFCIAALRKGRFLNLRA